MPNYRASFYIKYNDGTQEKSIYHSSMTQDLTTVDVVSATGYNITKIDTPYYNDTDWQGKEIQVPLSFEYKDTKVDDTHHTLQFYVTNGALTTFHDSPSKAYIYIPVTTEKAAAAQPITANFTVRYNDGEKTQSINFTSQTAGTVSGTVKAADGYNITQIINAYYTVAGVKNYFDNLKSTKVSDSEYNFSFDITDTQLKRLNNGRITLTVATEVKQVPVTTATINVQYNNGADTQTITFPNQTAGTISGTVSAADGYTITGINEAYYYVAGFKTSLDNLTSSKVSDTEYHFSFDLSDDDISHFKNSPNGHITLDVETEEKEKPPLSLDLKVKYNDGVTNQTIDYPNQTAGTVTGTVKAAAGYNITSVDEAYYYVAGFKQTLDTFSSSKISDTEYSFSFDIADDEELQELHNQNITLNVNTVPAGVDITVKYNNGAGIQTLKYTKIAAGQTISGVINAASGYTISSVTNAWYKDKYTIGNTSVTNFLAVKVSNYKYNFSFELTEKDVNNFAKNSDYFITIDVATAKELGNISIDTSGLVNCTVTPSTVKQDTPTEITLSADLGYILNGNGTYTVDGKETNFTCNNASSYKFTVTADKTIAVAFTATKVETKPASISHTYVLDEVGYNLLGKQYIKTVNAKGDGFEQYDYSNFVNYLYAIPFAVTDSITKPTETISIGKVSLDVSCHYVTHETYTIDLGKIILPAKDSTDYKVNEVLLYVPFCAEIELPYSVLGSTINIAMQINLLNESATLIVSQDDTVIVTRDTDIFTDLPLYFSVGTKDILVKTFKTQYQNTVKQAYISIAYNKPITNLCSYKTNEHGVLSDYKGFTRVTRGTLKNSINEEIDNLIIDQLQQGVIIK